MVCCGSPQGLELKRVAGTLPAGWLLYRSLGSTLATNMSVLDVSYNDLNGSLPSLAAPAGPNAASTGARTSAAVTVDPMNAGYGLCGTVPDGAVVLSAQAAQPRLQGTLPAGPCPPGMENLNLACAQAVLYCVERVA